jgi:hypothetical protein
VHLTRRIITVMTPVHVLLLELPSLFRDILERAIYDDSRCELVKDVDPTARRGDISPDVIVLGLRANEDATLVPALLARWPSTHVITVMQDGDAAVIHELQTRRQELGELSAPEIVGMLRDAVERSRHGTPS